MGTDGAHQVVDDAALPQVQALHHRQHPLREPAARVAAPAPVVGTKGYSPGSPAANFAGPRR